MAGKDQPYTTWLANLSTWHDRKRMVTAQEVVRVMAADAAAEGETDMTSTAAAAHTTPSTAAAAEPMASGSTGTLRRVKKMEDRLVKTSKGLEKMFEKMKFTTGKKDEIVPT